MKRGAWVVCRLYGGFGKIEVVRVFEGGGVGVDTPMQTMKYAITLTMILFF